MSALFLAPQRFTVNAASATATAPAANLLNDASGMVWRSNGLTTPYVILATAGQPFDTIALVGGNLGLTDTGRPIRRGRTRRPNGAARWPPRARSRPP